MLCRKKIVIFQSNEPCTYAFCTFWGVGITLKSPSGRHASVGTMRQSEGLALSETNIKGCNPRRKRIRLV